MIMRVCSYSITFWFGIKTCDEIALAASDVKEFTGDFENVAYFFLFPPI
jgi:hypothetical protein